MRVAVADGGDREGDAEAYLDLDAVPLRRAEAYVDVEHLLEGDVDAYVDAERLLDRRRDAGGRSDDDVAGAETDGTRAEPVTLSTTEFDDETGFDWVEGLSSDGEGDGDDGEATESGSPAAAFAAVTGFDASAGSSGTTEGDEDEADGANEDDWSVAGSLDPEQVTRTRVGEGGREHVDVDVDDGSRIGEAGEAPLDLDDFVPGDLVGEPAGLDPEQVRRVESTESDEAVSRLKVYGPRRRRARERGRVEDGDARRDERGGRS